jgi:BirA family biotin operon repressor/biotin-[acetyl-CoA-carboxylase] ligase
MLPDPIEPDALRTRAGIATFIHLAEADSTMDRARTVATDPAIPLPAAVVADRQLAGRGRRGARWWQPPGSLAVSLVLDATVGGGEVRPTWSLACGVALAEALAALEPALEPRVRWPNDIEADGAKLAGILVEMVPGGRVIFGVGVNTTGRAADAPAGIGRAVATLPDLVGRPLPRERLLGAFVPRLLALLAEMASDPDALAARYRPLCALTGRDVTVFRGPSAGGGPDRIHGPCLGIDRYGALVIDTVAGRLHLESGSLTDPAAAWRGPTDG